MDVKNVIFPMTAGDLVHGACVVTWNNRHGGPALAWGVVNQVKYLDKKNTMLQITFEPDHDGKISVISINKNTLVLVTNITRW